MVGLVISVAVAYGSVRPPSASLIMHPTRSNVIIDNNKWMIREFAGISISWYTILRTKPGAVASTDSNKPEVPNFVVRTCQMTATSNSTFTNVYAYGWPMRCIWSADYISEQSDNQTPRLGHLKALGISFGKMRVIPIGTIPLGIIGNSLLYGALTWFLASGSVIARRKHRHAHGQCRNCGYDLCKLHNRTCPECGHTSQA